MRNYLGTFALSILAVACGHAPAPPPAAPPTPLEAAAPPPNATTDELVARPEARALVAELERAREVGGERVSFDGHLSPEFATFSRLRAVATDAEMSALLRHRSPVVRSYAARHVIERDLPAASIEPLLVDATPVSFREGCLGGASSVSHLTLQTLCNFKAQNEAHRELVKLTTSAGAEAAELARECLAR